MLASNIQWCTDTIGIFTQKYITTNFYISYAALPYPLREIYTFLKLLSIIHVPMYKVHEKKQYKKRGYKYLTLLKIERIEYKKM